ncbi:probable cytochrome P450 12a5, mitochondrial [Anoplolepis gracilipes]|uniref:probable cytochrome P450 12a5, mitochondrial n=1 Tax=Anoplolepis gracilipes TaxID=354296 RepID=UPI003B9F70F6
MKNIMRVTFFICKINNLRLSSSMQCRAKSTKNCSVDSETKNKNEQQHVRPTEDIPGPKGFIPLFGNLFRFTRYILGEYGNADVMTEMRMLHKQYGDIVKLNDLTNHRSLIFLFSPQLCEQMYRLAGNSPIRISLESLYYYRKNRKHIYDGQYGLAVSQDKMWRDFRSRVNPYMMTPQRIKPHVMQISKVTHEFVEKMRTLRDPKTEELPRNFINELHKWSLESICSIALGCRLGCLKPNLAANSEPQIMINCVSDAFDLMHRLDNQPSLWKVYNKRNFKKLSHVLDTINEIAHKYIRHAKEKLGETTNRIDIDCQNQSVLENLLRIDEKTARIMALDMLIGGIDTIGNTAGGFLYYIANNPEKQEKLRKEVMSALPSKTSLVTYDMLNQIPYAKACIKESMRIFPITMFIIRTMREDISLGGYRIPAGFNVAACHALISESAQFPLAHEYIPERWLRDNTEFPLPTKPHPFAHMPFGYGPRTCIGKRFAEMELQILLLTIIRNFRIEWHHGPLEYKNQITNRLTMPLRFKLIDL